MKADVFSVEGKKLKSIDLPKVFSSAYEPGLIKRAVLAGQSARKQPKGVKPKAGRDNTAEYRGSRSLPQHARTINVGKARLPRMKNRRGLLSGRVAAVSQAVGGPKAHAPKVEQVIKEKVNKKEKAKAIASAIAATANKDLVSKRHILGNIVLPVIIESDFEKFAKTKQIVDVLSKIGIYEDIESAKSKKKRRAGKGKKRGRVHKRKKSILIVTGDKAEIYKAARNLEGVDISTVSSISAEKLAPGCMPGRLTVWTETAIEGLKAEKRVVA